MRTGLVQIFPENVILSTGRRSHPCPEDDLTAPSTARVRYLYHTDTFLTIPVKKLGGAMNMGIWWVKKVNGQG